MMTSLYYQYLINKKPVKLKKMKNYEATRSKIKLYLNALKERFSTSEWKEYHASEICKEFGITVTLPQILKNEGYYHYEHKNGIPSMMLSQKIMLMNEILAHNKIREYCNLSKERTAIKQIQKKEKEKLKKKRLDAKSANKAKKEQYLQKEGFVAFGGNWGDDVPFKNIGIKEGRNLYNQLYVECKRQGIDIKDLFTSILENQNPPKEQSIPQIKENLLNNPQFKDSFKSTIPTYDKAKIYKSVKPIRQANELIENLDEIEYAPSITGAYYPKTETGKANKEFYNMIERYHAPAKVIQEAESKVEAAETKIKSLETIMNLFLKGIINAEELESLKKGILK